jgi:Tol biopolymer transport system component
MNSNGKQLLRAFGSVVASVLVIGVLFVWWNRPDPVVTTQGSAAAVEQEQPAPPPAERPPTPTPRIVMVSPLPSPLPFPTPLPTPVVTRIPLASPPYIPLPEKPEETYTVFFRDGNLVKTISSADDVERTLVDVHAQTSLFLGRRETSVWVWGSASPDGRQLALVLTDFENWGDVGKIGQPTHRPPHFYIYLFDLTTGELRPLLENADKPVWSPDGTRLAFHNIKTRGLDVLDLQSGAITEIFSVEPESEHQADWFTWSPDGKRMAVVKTWSGYANSGGIWVVDAVQGGEMREIVEMEMNAAGLSWSPTDNAVIFLSGAGELDTTEPTTNLWIVNPETGERKQLTRNFTLGGGAPVWAPDRKWIAFAGTNLLEQEDAIYDLWLMAGDGSQLKRLTDDPVSDLDPIWTSIEQRLTFYKEAQGLWELDTSSGSTKQILPQITSYWFTR